LSTQTSVLALAEDPGGAEALLPVLKRISQRKSNSLTVLARNHAWTIFDTVGLKPIRCSHQGPDFSQWLRFADNWLVEHQPGQIVTATSDKGLLERAFIRASKRRGIHCLTLVDFWTNYARRFLLPNENGLREEILPHAIAVIDEFSLEEMKGFGFPEEILFATGQPAFQNFVLWTKSDQAQNARQKVRDHFKLNADQKLVLFVSQYISDMYPPGTDDYRGYTEFDVLSDLIQAVIALKPIPFLAIKLHPKEFPGKFDDPLKGVSSHIQVVHDFDIDTLVMAADILVGMTSSVLVKGALARHKIISYQPRLKGRDELVLSRMGVIDTIKDPEMLTTKLRAQLDTSRRGLQLPAVPDSWFAGRAVDHIISLIDNPPGEIQ